MTTIEGRELVAQVLGTNADSLSGSKPLAEAGQWDSLAVLDFIGMADEYCGKAVSPARVSKCKTVDDLVELLV
jgi:acyl carrier protein